MNVFASRISNNSWVMPVSAMCLILGVMIAMALATTNASRESRKSFIENSDQGQRVLAGSIDLQERYAQLSAQVSKLQSDNTKLENAVATQTGSTKVLNDNLQDLKVFAGLTEVEGPGLIVTLRDSLKPPTTTDVTIHDTDVLKVVNELFASGAEAISVNGHRVTVGTCYRCVGPVVHVDGEPVASPIVIRAIGDGPTLEGGMNLPLGVLDEIRSTDPAMVQLELAKDMRLPAYSGPTTKKYAIVPKVKK